MLLESIFLPITPSYYLTNFYVPSCLLLTQLGSPLGHVFLALSLWRLSFPLLCGLLPRLLLVISQSPRKLNPTFVSSPQLLAADVFIYQSELTGGGVPQATCRLLILEASP